MIPYFGGKNRLAKQIITKIPEHGCYVEAFAGGAGVFFRKNPSYWQIPGYRHDFCEQDFIDLAAALAKIQGKFLMSLNDTPEVRLFFKDFVIEQVQLRYSISAGDRQQVHTELLISNQD